MEVCILLLVLLLLTLCPVQLQLIEKISCDHTTTSCHCSPSSNACEFNLKISMLQTFSRYTVKDGRVDSLDGYVHYINDSGKVVPYQPNTVCVDTVCTKAVTVDGKSFRSFVAVNGQLPGPTLIVYFNQTIIVNVENHLRSQVVSIHWHGMQMYNTPWMDGTGFISQCPVGPGSRFRYIFKAQPSGTFWYHGHVEGLRSDGLLGALVVHRRDNGAVDYIDNPEKHTLVLQDWWPQPFSELFAILRSVLQRFFPGGVGKLPQLPKDDFQFTHSPDNAIVGIMPYFSGLINGKGRHSDVPYVNSKLSIFEIEQHGHSYRFRLVGGQSVYAYKFSIDNHKLKVIATDGYLIQPVEQVDFIIIHSGERYDFILEANQDPTQNYWIRAETLESDLNANTSSPPFESLNHGVEAILHYPNAEDPIGPNYMNITSSVPNCTDHNPCVAVNCPFKEFQGSYHIQCINIADLRLRSPTPEDEIPVATPEFGQEYFLNFGYAGYDGNVLPNNINGRIFKIPSPALQTEGNSFNSEDLCPDEPYSCEGGCNCLHLLELPFQKTVRLVLANIGKETHPIHLHGHSFFVVAVGYGDYDNTTGFLLRSTNAFTCRPDESDLDNIDRETCTKVSWRKGYDPSNSIHTTTPYTLRKDTVIVPAGGYVVLHFLSNNPGYWFLHCHMEAHLVEGMAMVLNIAPMMQNPPPEGMATCKDFTWSLEEFDQKLQFDPNSSNHTSGQLFCNCINKAELVVAVLSGTVGFVLLVVVPYSTAVILYCKHSQKKRATETSPYEVHPLVNDTSVDFEQ